MTNQLKKQLDIDGWIHIDSNTDDQTLINLSKKIGQIIKHPNGHQIDYLKPKKNTAALKNTFSFKYELEEFPFHTDTAFWNLPARYVLLSCEGLSSTATTFFNFEHLYKTLDSREITEFKKSVFLVKTPVTKFYTSIINLHENQTFLRFDTNCMIPANKSANHTLEIIEYKLDKLLFNKIVWDKPKVFIFDNWKILHGRESVKYDENRVLKRIYIK